MRAIWRWLKSDDILHDMNEELRVKLEEFIRKFYKNRLMKGAFYGLGIGALYFLLITFLELVGRFSGSVRAGLFFTLVLGLVVIIGRYIIWPLINLAGVGRQISYERAAKIIGVHFPEVDDKLTNTLQLQSLSEGESDLVQASISQRISELKPIPFQSAIDLSQNKKYWPLLVIPILIFGGIALTGNWEDFNQSGRRIAEFNKEFVPEAPFSFVLQNEALVVEEGEDLELILGFQGTSLPTESSLLLNGRENRMNKKADGFYHFKLSNLNKNLSFSFNASGWKSEVYEIEVIPVPRIKNMSVSVIPPAYTQIRPYLTSVKPVLDVPVGSNVSWELDLDQSSKARLIWSEGEAAFELRDDSRFMLEKTVVKSLQYSVSLQNEHLKKLQIKDHSLEVIPDRYPEIEAIFIRDSSAVNQLFIEGEVADDYGFSKLELILEGEGLKVTKRLVLNLQSMTSDFTELLMLDSLSTEGSVELRVYLRVWDNDGVNGAKYSTSDAYQIKVVGLEEREQELEERYKQYLSGSSEMDKDQKELEKTLSEMQKELQGKKMLDWQDKSQLKELLDKQQELLMKQREREEELKELQKQEKDLGLKDEELEKKEEDINKITPEDKALEELMKEIEELMEKLNTEELRKKLDKMQEMNEQNQQAMERKDDLLKDLEFQKDVLKEAQKLKELGIKMKELSRDVEKEANPEGKNEDSEMEQQEKVEEEFEKSMEKIKELTEENEKFKKEVEKEQMDKQEEETKSEMQKAMEQMEQQEQAPSNESQKNAGESMEEMSESLQTAMMNMQSQQNKENLETLRQILENLKILSFSVEELSISSKNTGKNDPAFRDLLTEQKRLQDGTKIIEDSLVALGKRVPELEQVVFEELAKVNKNLNEGIQKLEELQSAQAAANQQLVMTSANNLALLLDETMQSMLNAQAQMMKGNQNCQKPGGGSPKPSMANMRKMQGELGKKMDQLKKGKQEGKGEGESKNGEGMSKEIVEMLSRQEQLRRALEEMMRDGEGQGTNGDLQKAIDEMKKLEQDLWDGDLNDNFKQRLKNIDTRLLESEKAELKQKKEKKRESETSNGQKQLYERELEKYLKEKGIERESIDRVPVNFQLYYRNQATDYLKAR